MYKKFMNMIYRLNLKNDRQLLKTDSLHNNIIL